MSHVRPTLDTGSIAPKFEGRAASGFLKFPQWSGESWLIVFSHPSLFLSELEALAERLLEIEQRDIKVIGLSRNWPDHVRYWKEALKSYTGEGKNVEIVRDEQGQISRLYKMLFEYDSKGVATIANTVVLVDPSEVIRLVMAYPLSLSTRCEEIFRFVDDNSGPFQDMPAEIFHQDAQGQGQIYVGEVVVSNDGSAATTDVVKSAATVINNVISESSSGSSSSTATDYVQHAIDVMDSLADLGKVMPFVAPAFVIIKAIIAVEQRARDVDTKCTDLVQRVTFMLSHLPALKKINVTDSTRQVIDRMNDTLKKSAALIQTYRKQSAVARRLSVHNKDRFASCALLVTQCTNDLMISLQIHQSVQLDILARPVPSDPEDEAAASFIDAHGGIDAVKGDEALVKQFASQMKLVVDDKIMEQLNTNISEVLQQNHDRLEQSLNDTVSASVIHGITDLATQLNESAKEQTFVCVQCNKQYHDSTNGEKSCSFHRADYDSWFKNYSCCSTQNPCQAGRHRPEHHCEYPYGNFFPFAYGILNYSDTKEEWTSVEDLNYETNEKVTVSVARLLRWKSRGAVPEIPTILIKVGQLSISKPFFFKTFNVHDLKVIARVVEITHQAVIFRSSHSEDEFSMAEWVLSAEGIISGVKLTAKASTSVQPYVQYCPIDISSCTKSGDVSTLSEGSFRAYKPSTPYILPEVQQVSGTLPEGKPRAVRKFKAQTTPNFPVIVKLMSDPPLVANPEFAISASDYFIGSISVFNKRAVSSMDPVTIASVTGFYRLVGDEEYKPVKSVELLNGVVMPCSIDPRQTWTLNFRVTVLRDSEDAKVADSWLYCAFIARQRPLRIKLVLTDIEDEECSLVLDYVCPMRKQLGAGGDDIAFFYVADPLTWQRYCVHVAHDSKTGVEISNEFSTADRVTTKQAHQFTADIMKKIVYKALQSGDSEVDLDIGKDIDIGKSTAWSWKAWALIDLSCQRIYAFKILIKKYNEGAQDYACLGYAACPEYCEFYDEMRPIRYATEMIKFPELDPYVASPVILDDEFDDFVPEVPDTVQTGPSAPESDGRLESKVDDFVQAYKAPIIVQTGSPALLAVLEKMNKHLESIDENLSRQAREQEENSNSNLSRIARALEQLSHGSRF
ncbi:hypothetical protein BDP27DRAFT_1445624 [Rhodocollybia butyracea]|uniref:Alkyl hydroperoxide reductase subunit C/ Thiol specific antioxidant domain-containing protein n=1 Tax=Rhodocollybia butyracea TaxID=206335 RepID=A0A9P5PUH1_9AGAR|nr:hypothetical protein BDP27DRAFT_1445624 [Rhodocollybia butyracea]